MTLPISLIVAHFAADFLYQTDKMALNKSKSWGWLAFHVGIYSGIMAIVAGGLFFPFDMRSQVIFLSVTFVTHFVTDALTSRATSKLWFFERSYGDGPNLWIAKEPSTRHWFFVMIGLDQLVHYVTLAATLNMLS